MGPNAAFATKPFRSYNYFNTYTDRNTSSVKIFLTTQTKFMNSHAKNISQNGEIQTPGVPAPGREMNRAIMTVCVAGICFLFILRLYEGIPVTF